MKKVILIVLIKFRQILDLFERNFEEVERQYVFRSMTVGQPGFSYSEMAGWATDSRKVLETEVNVR